MRLPPLILSLLGFAAGSASAAVSLNDLATNSPFMLKQAENAPAPVTENATVEFRGMIATKDGMLFGLYDRTRNIGAWVKQNDKGADFVVSSFDASGDLVTVDYQGQKYTLPLSSSKIAAAAAAPMPVPVPAVQPVNNGGAPAVAKVDDQRRLENVAAEVRRRRALRQATASGANPAPANAGNNQRQ